ncbi:hypothetical protein [Streptomyces sp. NBC_00670]|uniref:hypothetical protein n=1 Tax=Streptomyces sp. NBC_00670 TaxID=2975804 RepID=UPI002E30CAEF|nr:hypothetical protein [Streptomyces sp. NBC_00670]
MRSLPLPLALTARLLPVAVLASAGWALSSGPLASASDSDSGHSAAERSPDAGSSAGKKDGDGSGSSASPAAKAYDAAPAACDSIAEKTVKSLVPGAKTAGKEIPSTDEAVRRTCSWNALKGFDYRWLDVSFEIADSVKAAQTAYEDRTKEKSGGGAVPGLGDQGYSVVNLTTDKKQQTREGVVLARVSNALVVVTYNGSDFESKKAPGTDEINKGAIKAAKEAVAALGKG